MTIFAHSKRSAKEPARDVLAVLRDTLERLNDEPETPRIADLRRILAARIAELESRSA